MSVVLLMHQSGVLLREEATSYVESDHFVEVSVAVVAEIEMSVVLILTVC